MAPGVDAIPNRSSRPKILLREAWREGTRTTRRMRSTKQSGILGGSSKRRKLFFYTKGLRPELAKCRFGAHDIGNADSHHHHALTITQGLIGYR